MHVKEGSQRRNAKAIEDAKQSIEEDRLDIGRFGEGWVAEEALSMTLYACLCFGAMSTTFNLPNTDDSHLVCH